MSDQENILKLINENINLQKAVKRVIEGIEADFEIINFCVNTIISEPERKIFIDNYNYHSSDKYTRHKAFNRVQIRKHGHSRIN